LTFSSESRDSYFIAKEEKLPVGHIRTPEAIAEAHIFVMKVSEAPILSEQTGFSPGTPTTHTLLIRLSSLTVEVTWCEFIWVVYYSN
jgi:hypothetical protein